MNKHEYRSTDGMTWKQYVALYILIALAGAGTYYLAMGLFIGFTNAFGL